MRGRAHHAVLHAVLVLGFGGTARAEFCRAKACDNLPAYDDIWQTEPDPPCDRDNNGCLIEGKPLFWPHNCMSFSVQRDGSKAQGIDFDTTRAIVNEAFDAWLGADCGGGATPSFAIVDHSPAICAEIEYKENHQNANVIVFRDDDWPHRDDPSATLALTTITYNTETAAIYDVDIEINSADATFTTTDAGEDVRNDLKSVLTHEVGHFLGLSHDGVPTATMYKTYFDGHTEQRTLEPSDIAGICTLYPPGNNIHSDQCEPRQGFSRLCAADQESGGCGVSPRRAGTTAALFTALAGVGILVRRVRRRKP